MSKRGSSRHYVSPVIISQYKDEVTEDGMVFRGLAGVAGTLIGGAVVTDCLPENTKSVASSLRVEDRDGSGHSETITTMRGSGELVTEMVVKKTSKIIVTTDCIGAKGVWIAMAILPDVVNELMQKVERDEPGVSVQTRRKGPARRVKKA